MAGSSRRRQGVIACTRYSQQLVTRYLEWRSPVVRMVWRRWRVTARARRVPRFLGSETLSSRGMVPMVQSQQREAGQRSRPMLMETRWEWVRRRGRGSARLAGLSNLVKTGREEPWRCILARRRITREPSRLRSDGRAGTSRRASSDGRGEVLGLVTSR